VYNHSTVAKPVIHVSEDEAARTFADLMARVREGSEVIIEKNSSPIAVLHPAEPERRSISEAIALLSEDSKGVVDSDFAAAVRAAVDSHPESLDPPSWD
jgi:prevent-host-death family protein